MGGQIHEMGQTVRIRDGRSVRVSLLSLQAAPAQASGERESGGIVTLISMCRGGARAADYRDQCLPHRRRGRKRRGLVEREGG